MRTEDDLPRNPPSAIPVDNLVFQQLPPGYHFRTHLHHTAELFVCTAGQVVVTILGSDILVTQGEFFLYFPDIPHSITVTGTQTFCAIQMHFHSRPFIEEAAPSMEGGSAFAVELLLRRRKYLRGVATEQLVACMKGVHQELRNRQPDARGMIGLYLAQLGVLLSRELAEASSSGTIHQNRYLLGASRFISENYMKKLSVQDVADAVGISPRYLTKLFHENFDLGVSAYITQVRVSKAIDFMYSNPGYPLTKLALDMGFSSQQHFSKVFKEKMTVSPKRYFSLQRDNI